MIDWLPGKWWKREEDELLIVIVICFFSKIVVLGIFSCIGFVALNFSLGSDISCEAVYEDSAVHITYLAGDVHEDPRSFKVLESGSGFWVGCPNGLTRTEPRLGEYKGGSF